jgi:hypothetical protein
VKCTRPVVLKKKSDYNGLDGYHEVPCGYCPGCRIEKSKQWAIRISHESKMYDRNCFVTLTYNKKNLLFGGSARATVFKPDLQGFFKRLRKNVKFRYFACGEYGEQYARPHYHVIFFGVDFRDYSDVRQDNRLLTLKEAYLEPAWNKGLIHIGGLTPASAQYCAKYVTKKLYGDDALYYDEQGIQSEFALMSRKPGIGAKFFDEYLKGEMQDYIVCDGKKSALPRYYRERKFDTDEKKAEYKRRALQRIKEAETDLIRRSKINGLPYDRINRHLFKVPSPQEYLEFEQMEVNINRRLQDQKTKL